MSKPSNPFPAADGDRHAIWTMLVERDVEAFVRRDWSLIEGDFLTAGFLGLDARGRANPDAWHLAFPTVQAYRDAWLEQARGFENALAPEALRAALDDATTLRDIEVRGDAALAHKKFDGEVVHAGGRDVLAWQTLYHCVRHDGRWKIAGFVGYLPLTMTAASGSAQAGSLGSPRKQVPVGAGQHATAGPYSPVLRLTPGDLVVISGQAAIAEDGMVVGDDVAVQAELTMQNCAAQLAAAGCGFADVFKVNVYLADLADWGAFNDVYRELMPEPKPVRTAVQTGLLEGLLVEVEMWAAAP